jgi:hypothetical protein
VRETVSESDRERERERQRETERQREESEVVRACVSQELTVSPIWSLLNFVIFLTVLSKTRNRSLTVC